MRVVVVVVMLETFNLFIVMENRNVEHDSRWITHSAGIFFGPFRTRA